MKMEEHIEYLKILRIPFKAGVLRAFYHILNEHKDEIDIDDLIKATCVYKKREKPREEPVVKPVARPFRDRRPYRERRPRRRYRDRY